MWQIWLIIAGIFFVGEIFTVGFLLFWFGIGALIALITSLITSNVIIQTVVFLISSVILLFATKPLVNKFLNTGKSVKTNAFSIVGKNALVIKDIDSMKGKGQIRVDYEVWSAESEDGEPIEKDTEVNIVRIDGVKAVVRKI